MMLKIVEKTPYPENRRPRSFWVEDPLLNKNLNKLQLAVSIRNTVTQI